MRASDLSEPQRNTLIFLRLSIGWHFLYEGVLKLYDPSWTAKAYLLSAEGPFERMFHWLATDGTISVINYLNVIGLIAIGLGLVLGLLERPAALAGVVLLGFYYLSHPPLAGASVPGAEGNYWLVNKNLIEALALLVIYQLPTSYHFGLEPLLRNYRSTLKPQGHGK